MQTATGKKKKSGRIDYIISSVDSCDLYRIFVCARQIPSTHKLLYCFDTFAHNKDIHLALRHRHKQKRHIVDTTMKHFTSTLLLASLFCLETSVAFLTTISKANSPRLSAGEIFLFVENSGDGGIMDGMEKYSKEVIESSKQNQWGIPSCDILEPLSPTPLEELGNGGKITLVGSGPGDPDLLTIKAYQLLQDPDAVVIADRLVSQEILDLVQGDIKVARKLPGCAENAQAEIYWWAYQGLSAGKHVIRLKIGDPFVFGRGGEEVLQFRKFGVESKVVPVSIIYLMSSPPNWFMNCIRPSHALVYKF